MRMHSPARAAQEANNNLPSINKEVFVWLEAGEWRIPGGSQLVSLNWLWKANTWTLWPRTRRTFRSDNMTLTYGSYGSDARKMINSLLVCNLTLREAEADARSIIRAILEFSATREERPWFLGCYGRGSPAPVRPVMWRWCWQCSVCTGTRKGSGEYRRVKGPNLCLHYGM